MRKSNYLWLLLVAVLLLPAQEMAAKKKKEKEVTDRELWAGVLYQMAAPVLSNMSEGDRKSTRLNSSHSRASRMPSSA